MHPTTLQKYQTRARNFYRTRCGEDDPSSAQICAALLASAHEFQPNAFSTLKSTLVTDQLVRGDTDAAEAIRTLANPVTALGSTMARKPKTRKVRKVSKEDTKALFKHLRAHDHHDEAAALILANFLGVRPCEMRTISVTGNEVHIIGGKKSAPLHRGADRKLEIGSPKILNAIRWAAKRMAKCERTNTAIRDRFRKECRALWPRRKMHPTLKSFRHQFSSVLKAVGGGAETRAYVMGHQSTESHSVYGDPRSAGDGQSHIRPAEGADLSKIRTPQKAPRYGSDRVVGRIEFPASTRGNWLTAQQKIGRGQEI